MSSTARTKVLLLVTTLILLGASETPSPGETSFLAENAQAMDRMMAGMAVPASGDVDRDFVAMMSAHHQGAVGMAMSQLRHGRNEQLRRIAQGIIVEQQQEIAAMQLAFGQPAPIRQIVQGQQGSERRHLVVLPGTAEQHGDPVQVH